MPAKTQQDIYRERWNARKSEPYVPAGVATQAGTMPGPDVRVAHALEYIAAQLGEINAKLTVIANATKGDGKS